MSDAARPLRAVDTPTIDDRTASRTPAVLVPLAERAEPWALAEGAHWAVPRSPARFERVYIAANNGGIGGGEVMLLRLADAMHALGVDVTVVAPAPSAVLNEAVHRGLPVIGLPARRRLRWMWALRRWDRARPDGLLWCNGLVPSLATARRPGRLVHLHQEPSGLRRILAKLARRDAVTTLVPSRAMLDAVPEALVLPNWTEQIRRAKPAPDKDGRIRIGFLGRLGLDKGVHILADALGLLEDRMPGRFRLVLAGEPLFVPEEDLEVMEEALGPVARLTHRAGWVDAAEFFDTIDLLVVPSIVPESFGLVAAEAMAARVPLIVSDAGALPEVVGGAAQVVPAGDADVLADRIAALATGGIPAHRGPLFERWFAEFSPAAGASRMRELVDTLGVRRSEPPHA
ncbi:MAG: glycosyltransferase family 4 protein [Microbacterium sp.]|jgi:glycosyltransferase involved in cell wall biosynthesis|uniref:glycosyltransferase family 4 protein n=1 Tax=Microbacterium sp. TaxID=51671 RepID=UPI002825F17C|nr:glycosyltransferase family 4 protein [Microbacterium sp.]MDR2323527.1 glycosyltransferase family 4 protein [Microbacterium sp.]